MEIKPRELHDEGSFEILPHFNDSQNSVEDRASTLELFPTEKPICSVVDLELLSLSIVSDTSSEPEDSGQKSESGEKPKDFSNPLPVECCESSRKPFIPVLVLLNESDCKYKPPEKEMDNPQSSLAMVQDLSSGENPRPSNLFLNDVEKELGVCPDEYVGKNGDKQIYRGGRSPCSKRICQLASNGLKFYNWFSGNRVVHSVLQGAKCSLTNFLNAFELEFKHILGSDGLMKLTIVGEEMHCKAIEECFGSVFRGRQILTNFMNPRLLTIPVLPVGHAAGVHAAELKIHYARQYDSNSIIVSTSVLIFQSVLQRWQMTTVICLDDPHIQLKLHNFTVTVPIPNKYVVEAANWTSSDYALKDLGLATTIDQVIGYFSDMRTTDTLQFLSGVDSYGTFKSAALVLAGMYKKYSTGLT